MLELISILASFVMLIATPIEVNRIRRGIVPKKAEADPEKYRAAFRRQISIFVWLGLVLGLIQLGLSFLDKTPGENIVKIIAGVIWLAVSAVCFISARRLPPPAVAAAPTSPPPGP